MSIVHPLELNKHYSFKSYHNDTRWLLKLLSFDGTYYKFDKVEDLKFPPFRYYKGPDKIDKWTIENWISERDFKIENIAG